MRVCKHITISGGYRRSPCFVHFGIMGLCGETKDKIQCRGKGTPSEKNMGQGRDFYFVSVCLQHN